MALLFMDGFGGGDSNQKWDLNSSAVSVLTATPRIAGCYYTQGGSLGSALNKTIPASNKVIMGHGVAGDVGGNYVAFFGDSGATQHITVLRNTSTGLIEIRRGTATGTLLATGTQPLYTAQWNYVEVSVTISDTVGEVHVRLNGSLTDEVSYVGDTKNAGTNTTIDKITIAMTGGSGVNKSMISDVYILNDTGAGPNNTFLGDVVVRTLSPNGNGTYSMLVGSDGDSINNYLLVDEHPYSGTDYAGSANTGDKDTYTMTDLPNGVTTVYGVQVTGKMAKNDATLGQARYIVRSGGTDYGGTTRALTTSFTGYSDLYETDPATGVQWTPTAVNNMESGMEVM